jgi:hypothetical protein
LNHTPALDTSSGKYLQAFKINQKIISSVLPFNAEGFVALNRFFWKRITLLLNIEREGQN